MVTEKRKRNTTYINRKIVDKKTFYFFLETLWSALAGITLYPTRRKVSGNLFSLLSK